MFRSPCSQTNRSTGSAIVEPHVASTWILRAPSAIKHEEWPIRLWCRVHGVRSAAGF